VGPTAVWTVAPFNTKDGSAAHVKHPHRRITRKAKNMTLSAFMVTPLE